MPHAADTLMALGGAFVVCALVARAGGRLGLPTVPLFMLAGVVFGPSTPGIDLVSDPEDLELVARLGLVFLLFYLGLEFTLDQLAAGGRRLVTAASIYLLLNVGGGVAYGFWVGWGAPEAFVIAGVVGISSTAIVTKVLVETRRLGNRETRTILGIAVIEDIFLAFYLALLQPILGGADTWQEAVTGIATAFAFLVTLGAIARYGAAQVGRLVSTHDEEIVVVLFVGLAVTTAGIAEALGVSDAIGAFMVGLILGATTRAGRLRTLTHPLRDAFGAIFFFHFGLTIDPGEVVGVLPQIAVAVVMTIVLATAAGVIAARMYRFTRVEAGNIGFTVLTRGEFSIILASLAVAAGLDRRIGSLAAGYVLVLAIVGPVAAAHSQTFARLIPNRLLRPGEMKWGETPLDLEAGVGSLHHLGSELLQVTVTPGSRLHGVYVWELRLPPGVTLGLLARDGSTRSLEDDTVLRIGDVLLVFTRPELRLSAERRILAVHRAGRLAQWRGETGD
ncbi:cation:proton antiporter [Oryzobacter telluris]|uniref:cation:proton antiporter n=1 Tax=Oryzobacter telluris TaxID=3149179 RepID=UPI00370D9F21